MSSHVSQCMVYWLSVCHRSKVYRNIDFVLRSRFISGWMCWYFFFSQHALLLSMDIDIGVLLISALIFLHPAEFTEEESMTPPLHVPQFHISCISFTVPSFWPQTSYAPSSTHHPKISSSWFLLDLQSRVTFWRVLIISSCQAAYY